MAKRVAVILCGSGFKDGSEIRESVALLWAMSAQHIEVECFAPDAPQFDVVNCLTGTTIEGESRNMLVESARIARAKVAPLSQLTPEHFAGLAIPGGFGVAKNLCSFAREGHRGRVRADIAPILDAFYEAQKPIAGVCIAPALLALHFRERPLELTLGAPGEAAQEIERLGHRHVPKGAGDYHYDPLNRIYSTPAYMHDSAPLFEIFEGIRKMSEDFARRL